MDIDKLIPVPLPGTSLFRFGSLMDIDKLIRMANEVPPQEGFGSLMDIDKLIPVPLPGTSLFRFGSLMDIDKLRR